MRPTKLAHKSADRLPRRGGLEVELTSLGHPLMVAGFALSISGRFSAVHRGFDGPRPHADHHDPTLPAPSDGGPQREPPKGVDPQPARVVVPRVQPVQGSVYLFLIGGVDQEGNKASRTGWTKRAGYGIESVPGFPLRVMLRQSRPVGRRSRHSRSSSVRCRRTPTVAALAQAASRHARERAVDFLRELRRVHGLIVLAFGPRLVGRIDVALRNELGRGPDSVGVHQELALGIAAGAILLHDFGREFRLREAVLLIEAAATYQSPVQDAAEFLLQLLLQVAVTLLGRHRNAEWHVEDAAPHAVGAVSDHRPVVRADYEASRWQELQRVAALAIDVDDVAADKLLDGRFWNAHVLDLRRDVSQLPERSHQLETLIKNLQRQA